jgi:hypothetical protein
LFCQQDHMTPRMDILADQGAVVGVGGPPPGVGLGGLVGTGVSSGGEVGVGNFVGALVPVGGTFVAVGGAGVALAGG